MGVGGQLIRGGDYGVVEGGAAAGLDVGQAVFELVGVGGQVLVDVGVVGEIDDEGLVFGVGGQDQVERGFVDRGALFVHGAGVVDDQTDGDGDVGVLEAEQVLLDAVFENLEVVFLEVLDDLTFVVEHGDVEGDFFDFGADYVVRRLAW